MKNGFGCLRFWFPRAGVGFVLLAFVLSSTGCEPLRKKFVRKSKEAPAGREVIPIMTPEEYLAPVHSPQAEYTRNYSLTLAWVQEMTIAVQEKKTEKKVQSCFDKVKAGVAALRDLLAEDARGKADSSLALLNGMEAAVNEQTALRNDMLLVKRLRELDRTIRRELRLAVVSTQLVKEVPIQP